MISLHRLNGSEFVLNCELIQTLESTPDTVVTLVSGEKLIVREAIPEVVELVREFRRSVRIVTREMDHA